MPIGNSDFARDFQIGASVGRMRQQREERMIELRAQAAQQAMQERQYVAQAQMLSEHARLFRAQADQEEQQQRDEIALARSLQVQHESNRKNGLTDDESMQQLITSAMIANPIFGEKISRGYGELKRANVAGIQQPTANMKDTANEMQLRMAMQSARTPEEREAIQQELDSFMARSIPSGETTTMEVDPTTGRVTTTYTKGGARSQTASGLERSTKAEVEKKIQASLNSMSLVKEAMRGISPSSVCPAGIVNEGIETVKSWAKPGSPAPVTGARQDMRMAAQSMYSSLKADSQINKMEAEEMRAIAQITGWGSASDPATEKYERILDLTGLQTILRAKEIGQPAPDKALGMISYKGINRFRKSGSLTPEEVDRWDQITGFSKNAK